MPGSSSAAEIDAYVGQRIRLRREALGISQGRLGRQLGLTFSQIQKYEKGSNRIGAGRLYQIAAFLGVQTSHFFEGLENGAHENGSRLPGSPALRGEMRSLTEAYAAIGDADTRASVLALVRSLTMVNNGR